MGKQYEEAAQILRDLGMEPRRENFRGFWTVRTQSIEPGTKVVKGS